MPPHDSYDTMTTPPPPTTGRSPSASGKPFGVAPLSHVGYSQITALAVYN